MGATWLSPTISAPVHPPDRSGVSDLNGPSVRPSNLSTWAELWLVNKIFYTVWSKIQPLKQMLTLLGFRSFLKISKIVGQIIGMSRRTIFHAPKSSQMPYTAKIKNINNVHNKIQSSLELHLVMRIRSSMQYFSSKKVLRKCL